MVSDDFVVNSKSSSPNNTCHNSLQSMSSATTTINVTTEAAQGEDSRNISNGDDDHEMATYTEHNEHNGTAKGNNSKAHNDHSSLSCSSQNLQNGTLNNISSNDAAGLSYRNKTAHSPKVSLQSAAPVVVVDDWEFKANDESYLARSCCQCTSVRSGAIAVGVLQATAVLVWTAIIIWYYSFIAKNNVIIPGALLHCFGILGFTVSLTAMFYGIVVERPYFLLPQLFVTIAGIVVGVGLTLLSVICMSIGTSSAVLCFEKLFGTVFVSLSRDYLGPIWPFCLAVIFDTGAAISIWFYSLIYGCYIYICDKKYSESGKTLVFFWHPRSTESGKNM